jgi:hypothetical protein
MTRSQMAFIRGVRGRVVMTRSPSVLNTSGERGREERIAIVNQKPQRVDAVAQLHGQVAGLLHRPRPGWMRRHAAQVESAGSVLDEHQHVQPFEQYRLHDQEVARDDRVSLGGEELPPRRAGTPGCGVHAGGVQDLHTVDAAIVYPSRASSPWILRCPQVGFSRAMRTISVLVETQVGGRPGRRRSV